MVPNPGPRYPFEHLLAGLTFLVMGIVTEVSMHPVVPWTYIPGPIFTMIGLGVGMAAWEQYQPRPGTVAFCITLAGVVFWWLVNNRTISYLAPSLYISMHQLTRWVLKMAIPEE